MVSSTLKKMSARGAIAAAAGTALATTFAGPAFAVPSYGNTAQDAGGQPITVYGVTCVVTAGDPVVVTVSGVRYARSTATMSCNALVHVGTAVSALYTNGQIVQQRTATGAWYNRTTLSVIADRACYGTSNRYWAGIAQFDIDFNRDGYADYKVLDASLSNLRSCGL